MQYVEMLKRFVDRSMSPSAIPGAKPIGQLITLLDIVDPTANVRDILMEVLAARIASRLSGTPQGSWYTVQNVGSGPGRPSQTLHIAGLNTLPRAALMLAEQTIAEQDRGAVVTSQSSLPLAEYHRADLEAKKAMQMGGHS